MSRSRSLARALCLTPLLFGSPLLAQSVWTKVPVLPRACYSREDTFDGDAEKARAELEGLIDSQDQINRGLTHQVLNADPATLQQRIMAAVQRNPAQAQEIMQSIASLGTEQGQAPAVEAVAEGAEFDARREKLVAAYQSEKKRAMSLYAAPGPAARQAASGHEGATDPAVVAANNQKYRTQLCPKWFGQEVPALLAAYRTYLVERRIPTLAAAEVEGTRLPEMLGFSTKDFRPIAEMQAVADYLRFATALFGLRESEPIKP